MKKSRKVERTRTAIIVLGMHRSGTSAISGVLSLLGIATPRSLMVPTPDNPKGYWESTALMTVHDKVLRSGGSIWHDWGKFNPAWMDSPVAGQFADQLAAAIESEFEGAPAFLVKDPRMCRLMPLWRTVLDRLGIQARVILPIRKPLEVSLSLQARNRFGPMQAQALWLRHVLEAEKGTRGMVRSFTTYDELMEDWRGLVARVGQELGLAWPRWSAAVETEVDSFLAEDLRHNRRDDGDIRASGRPQDQWVQQAYDVMAGAVPQESIEARERLDRIMDDFDASCETYLPVVHEIESRLESEKKVLQSDLAASQGVLDMRVSEVARLSEELQASKESLAEADGSVKGLEVFAARLTEEGRKSNAENALLTQRVQDLERKLEDERLHGAELERLLEASREEASAADRRNQEEMEAFRSLKAAETDRLQERIAEDDARLERSAARISGFERDLEQERLRATELERLLEASREETSAADRRYQEEMEALRLLKAAETDRLQSQIVALKASIDERFVETKKLTEMVFSLESQVEAASAELEAVRSASATQVAGLKQRLTAARTSAALEASALHGVIESQRSVIERFNQWGDAVLASRSLRTARLLRGGGGKLRIPTFVQHEGMDDVEIIRRSGYFNGDWYLQRYEDVKRRKADPARHYLEYGAREGRDPGPAFDTRGYLQRNPDVVASGMNPLVHYLRHGMQEARFAGRIATGG